MRRLSQVLLVCLLGAGSASAQTYVSAAIGADISKSFESTTNGTTTSSNDESLSWGLRLGTALGSRWGVELEFNRGSEVETGTGGIVYPLAQLGIDATNLRIYTPQVETEQRTTTWNATAWVTQPLGDRADLVFLGGIGFSRVVQKTEFSYGPIVLPSIVPVPDRTFRTTTTGYGVGPLVGVESRIRMTDNVALTPSFRVQSLGNDLVTGLLLRPAVALGWTF